MTCLQTLIPSLCSRPCVGGVCATNFSSPGLETTIPDMWTPQPTKSRYTRVSLNSTPGTGEAEGGPLPQPSVP